MLLTDMVQQGIAKNDTNKSPEEMPTNHKRWTDKSPEGTPTHVKLAQVLCCRCLSYQTLHLVLNIQIILQNVVKSSQLFLDFL